MTQAHYLIVEAMVRWELRARDNMVGGLTCCRRIDIP
jgi:hypothetical protein